MVKYDILKRMGSAKRLRVFLAHLIAILIFITFESSLIVFLDLSNGLWKITWYYPLEIATFYINLLFILPLLEQKGKEIRFALFLLLLIVTYCFSRIALLKVFFPIVFEEAAHANTVDQMYARAIWRGIYIIGMSIVYWLFKRDKKAALDKKQLEVDKLEAIAEKRRIEISLLQIQLEPHLITNVLAFIYNKIETTSPDAALAVERLSDLMKHSTTDVLNINKVPVSEEIEGIKTLIAIHDSLANRPVSIALNIEQTEGENASLIPPNILTTFIDNIFTHGVVDDPNMPAKIQIAADNSMFCFHSVNAKRNSMLKGRQLGMNNVRSILSFFYKEQYELKIEESESHYSLDLKIAL